MSAELKSRWCMVRLLLSAILVYDAATCAAQPVPEDARGDTEQAQQALAAQVLKSLVVVRATNRAGDESGFGTGFAVHQPGLIATARHVIGDGRDFVVELPDGSTAPVLEVFASSSQLDLAIIRIDNTSLPPLQLSSEDIAEKRPLVALGHPRGKRNQMASGVFSGIHAIEGIGMLELAMPIEPGNSGGPVLTTDGQVVGLVTMKSTVMDSVGYALPAQLIRQLLDKPNPVPMARWKTIGAMDASLWTTVFGAEWKQRSARIIVNGAGTSFGGRTLCVRKPPRPEFPFDLRVDVKLDDEQGAAGLIFHSDGGDRHYGFYPSAGNMRLTRFDGPDVGSWTILHNEPHPVYRMQGWNTLIVRIHVDHFECYLNGKKIIEARDDMLPHGSVGLAAFRGTPAEFRRFQTGADLLPKPLSADAQLAINAAVASISPQHPSSADAVTNLLPFGTSAEEGLSAEADRMEKKVRHLRQLAVEVHESAMRTQLANLPGIADTGEANAPPDQSNGSLLRAALLIARMDNPDVDVETYIERVQQMADEIRKSLPPDADEATRLTAMDRHLFEELGIHGSRFEYDTRANSYINEVIEDREGLPITLSVLYIDIARQLNLNVQGIGLPGHFVVQFAPAATPTDVQLIDPFEQGKRLSEEDVLARLSEARYPNLPQFRVPQTSVQICERMIGNLLGLAEREKDDAAVLRYLETLVMLVPASPEYRAKRLEIRARTGRLTNALDDANWFLEHQPDGIDLERLRDLRTSLESDLARRAAVDSGAD